MELRLHKNARTTPAVRAEIAASTEGVSALARRYGVGHRTFTQISAPCKPNSAMFISCERLVKIN
ncbi:MAG: hypothetical protein LBO00_04630, partial [Zoogloeaceae bacterium]|nr:hypothetical protein [Zoogloeaceae bacterium]